MTTTQDATEIAAELTELRHAIHSEPEIGLDLPLTQRKVLAALDGLPLEITLGSAVSSVTAVLRGGAGNAGPGRPVVLLRGDMDALPVTERTGVGYTSRIDGVMHACGHDLHTTMLAGAAKLLSARRAELPGDVIFMFQPGEEGQGGARYMISEGVLDAAGPRPAAAYALHVASSEWPHGVFATRPGPMLASAEVLTVTVTGHGGHASEPHNALDPIPAACEVVTALQTMVTRRFDVFDPVVITIGSFHSGTTDNVIPDEATFLASIRTFSHDARDRIHQEVPRLVQGIAAGHGLTGSAEFGNCYPVTLNSAAEVQFASSVIGDLLGPGRVHTMKDPLTGAEDFSYVASEVPGAFLMLGACPPGVDPAAAPANHSGDAVFHDGVLADGAAVYAELAIRRLAQEA
ncbi:MAG TPA: M20 family metallopeptidase [Streptosporangiaceae bacterium]|jgi:hippurate hydrolase